MADNDKTEIIVSILGLEKVFSPTMEYAGEQLLELVKFLVERAKHKLKKWNSERNFHGLYYIKQLDLIEDKSRVSDYEIMATGYNDLPYENYPKWWWPLGKKPSDSYINTIMKPAASYINYDPHEFIELIHQSLSLDINEKKRVINAVPTLTQYQIDELTKVFKEEKIKFSELFTEHTDDVWKLIFRQLSEWSQIVLDDKIGGLESFIIPPLNGKHLFKYFPYWPEFWLNIAELAEKELDDHRTASVGFSMYVKYKPESAYGWLSLGYSAVRLKHFEQALSYFYKSRTLNPDNEVVLLDIAELHILQKDFDLANSVISNINIEKLPSKYHHVFEVLRWINNAYTGNHQETLPESISNYISNLSSTSNWYWNDLLKFARTHAKNTSLTDDQSKNLIYVLAQLVILHENT